MWIKFNNIENSKINADEDKHFKKKIGEEFIHFMKEILMHHTSESKAKNYEEFFPKIIKRLENIIPCDELLVKYYIKIFIFANSCFFG